MAEQRKRRELAQRTPSSARPLQARSGVKGVSQVASIDNRQGSHQSMASWRAGTLWPSCVAASTIAEATRHSARIQRPLRLAARRSVPFRSAGSQRQRSCAAIASTTPSRKALSMTRCP